MDKTKEEYIVLLRQALADPNSPAALELYLWLVQIYVRVDTNLDGRIDEDEFGGLVDAVNALPKAFGLPADSVDKSAVFKEMDADGDGSITIEEWLAYARKDIAAQAKKLPKDILGGSSADVTKDEYVACVKKAVQKGSPESAELYHSLLKAFMKGDINKDGKVAPNEFEAMIDDATKGVKKHGIAAFGELLKSADDKKAAFASIDTNNDGGISFDEWLTYAINHMTEKIANA